MEYLNLIGIVIVIAGFALKMDSILTIMIAGISVCMVSGLGIEGLLVTLGESFVNNRSMTIFIMVMLVTGTLERNGLKEGAANLIGKVNNASAGVILGIYAIMRGIFGSFNIGFGGVAGFVSPVIMPMIVASIENEYGEPNEKHMEELKGMASGTENIVWFFTQVLFVGGAGALLVQGTLGGLGYEVELIELAKVQIPVAIFAIALTVVFYYLKDKRLSKELYKK